MEPCTHPRRLSINAKCSDMCSVRFPNGHETDGYMIRGLGLGCGDYIEFEVCIDCKALTTLASPEIIIAAEAIRWPPLESPREQRP